MKSKVATRILSKTKKEVRQNVRDISDIIVKIQTMIDIHRQNDGGSDIVVSQYVSIFDNLSKLLKQESLGLSNPYHRFKGSRYFYLWVWYQRKMERYRRNQIFDMKEVLNRLKDFK